MADKKLKLVKFGPARPDRATHRAAQVVEMPDLTEAEAAEAARFKEMIAARAARQATLHRIIAEIEALDEMSSAA